MVRRSMFMLIRCFKFVLYQVFFRFMFQNLFLVLIGYLSSSYLYQQKLVWLQYLHVVLVLFVNFWFFVHRHMTWIMVLPFTSKRKHSPKELSLLPVIRKAREGNLTSIKELVRITSTRRIDICLRGNWQRMLTVFRGRRWRSSLNLQVSEKKLNMYIVLTACIWLITDNNCSYNLNDRSAITTLTLQWVLLSGLTFTMQ